MAVKSFRCYIIPVKYHTHLAVYSGSLGVDVYGFLHLALYIYTVGIKNIFVISFEGVFPNTVFL